MYQALPQVFSPGNRSNITSRTSLKSISGRGTYRKINKGSQIDESLFGPQSEKTTGATPWSEPSRRCHSPTIQHVTKDLIRNIIIPNPEPPILTKVLTQEEFNKIKQLAHVVTKEEKEAKEKKMLDEQETKLEASLARKEHMNELDMIRLENSKLSDLEEEAKQRAEYLLQRANELRQEQEDEIKHLNEMILNSKIQTIRDSQVVEHQLIKRETKHAEQNLDNMMEKERMDGIRKEEQQERKRKENNMLYSKELKAQMCANEEARNLDLEKKMREGEQMLQYIKKLHLEDSQNLQEHKSKQQNLLESLIRENNEVAKRKQYEKNRERTEDLWVMEYQKQKAEKEESKEKEMEEMKRSREKEIAKLRLSQERARDIHGEKDALRARRAQDEKEREWRRKEKENVEEKRKTEESLLAARDEQIALQDKLRVMKAEKEHEEYVTLVKKLNEAMEREQLKNQKKRNENFKHAAAVRKQIEEKEKERIEQRRAFFKEGVSEKQEDKLRRARLEAVKQKKLNELRKFDIPERYIQRINNKIQLK